MHTAMPSDVPIVCMLHSRWPLSGGPPGGAGSARRPKLRVPRPGVQLAGRCAHRRGWPSESIMRGTGNQWRMLPLSEGPWPCGALALEPALGPPRVLRVRRARTPMGERIPRGIVSIVLTEFCERFTYYGLRAVLVLYFRCYMRWSVLSARGARAAHSERGSCQGPPLVNGGEPHLHRFLLSLPAGRRLLVGLLLWQVR